MPVPALRRELAARALGVSAPINTRGLHCWANRRARQDESPTANLVEPTAELGAPQCSLSSPASIPNGRPAESARPACRAEASIALAN
jgi:hypothetical protein